MMSVLGDLSELPAWVLLWVAGLGWIGLAIVVRKPDAIFIWAVVGVLTAGAAWWLSISREIVEAIDE